MRPTFDLHAGKPVDDYNVGHGACKRPAGTSVAIEDMDWSSITEEYVCFTKDFDADAELSEHCDGQGDDDDSDDSTLILGVVAAFVVVSIVLAYLWKRQKSAKPLLSSSGPPPQSAPPPPVREPTAPPPPPLALTKADEVPPSTVLAEEAPAAEGWAAETMAEEAPQPSEGWAARSLQRLASWRQSPRQPEDSLEGAARASAETMAEEPAGADAGQMYHRLKGWYNDAPESAALRTAWGAYPTTPRALEAWPGFVTVTNAYLDHASPPVAPAAASAHPAEPEFGLEC